MSLQRPILEHTSAVRCLFKPNPASVPNSAPCLLLLAHLALGVSFLISDTIDSPALLGDIPFYVLKRSSINFTFKLRQCNHYEVFNPFRVRCKDPSYICTLISMSDSLKTIESTLLNTRALLMSFIDQFLISMLLQDSQIELHSLLSVSKLFFVCNGSSNKDLSRL